LTVEATITALIAIYGAVLATFTYIRDLRKDRGRAVVRAGYTAATQSEPNHPFLLAATIENHGREPIFLATVGVESYPHGISATTHPRKESPPLPFELRPGQRYTAFLDVDLVHSVASYGPSPHVRITFYDQLRRKYRSSIIGTGLPQKNTDGWQLETAEPLSFGMRVWQRFRRKQISATRRLSKIGPAKDKNGPNASGSG
jgi:hypothetical protein